MGHSRSMVQSMNFDPALKHERDTLRERWPAFVEDRFIVVALLNYIDILEARLARSGAYVTQLPFLTCGNCHGVLTHWPHTCGTPIVP